MSDNPEALTAEQVRKLSAAHGDIFGADWPAAFWTHAAQLVNAALAQQAATPPSAALLDIARRIEGLKRECGMDPESPQAIRNGQYMSIAYAVRDLAARQAATPAPAEPVAYQGVHEPWDFWRTKPEGIAVRPLYAAPPATPAAQPAETDNAAFLADKSPGSEWHLTLLMAPHHLNLVVGSDRQALLAWGRSVWAAALAAAPSAPSTAQEAG